VFKNITTGRLIGYQGQVGEEGEFRLYLDRIRVEYKRKRNFMKLLEEFGE